MISIDESAYAPIMWLLREAQVRPPVPACPGNPDWKFIERQLRTAMMEAISAELAAMA